MAWWDYKDIQSTLRHYYPKGVAWNAMLSEAECGFELNGDVGPQDIDGYAIDQDSDGHADLFLFEYGTYGNALTAYTGNIDAYLTQAQSRIETRSGTSVTIGPPSDIEPTGFPFRGQMLPDSRGKITSVLFVADRLHDKSIRHFLEVRPDLDCQVLTLPPDFYPKNLTNTEQKYLQENGRFLPTNIAEYDDSRDTRAKSATFTFAPAGLRESDWEPVRPELWVQDQFNVGTTLQGQLIGAAHYIDKLDTYTFPIVWRLGALQIKTDQYEAGGNMLSSATHFFVPKGMSLFPQTNFAQMFAYGKKIVSIDFYNVHSAAHLDMILTPTDDVIDGKPVVILAEATGTNRQGINKMEADTLDHIAEQLHPQFTVRRIPYLYTGIRAGLFLGTTDATTHSYNNVLMERYWNNKKLVQRVYMPWYDDQDDFNEPAAEVYRQLGYEVIPIPDLDDAARGGGALRCLVKVTHRELLGSVNTR